MPKYAQHDGQKTKSGALRCMAPSKAKLREREIEVAYYRPDMLDLRCGRACGEGFYVCRAHGAKAGAAVARGLTTRQINDRAAFIEALKGDDAAKIQMYLNKVHEIALAGSEAMLRYILDQCFGGPKSTLEVYLNRDQMAMAVRVTARHLQGEAFEAWLLDFNKAMEAVSGLANS